MPTPTVVFRSCVEAFRTKAVEVDKSKSIEVGGQARGLGGASLAKSDIDVARTEFAGLSQTDASAAIVECRRQEQVQRQAELEQALAQRDEARSQVDTLRDALEEAQQSVAAMEEDRVAAEEAYAELQETLTLRQAELEETVALLAHDRPCLAQAWKECAEAAAADHRAGEYASAHERYAAACEHGEVSACRDWGLMFEHGQGSTPDLDRAQTLYEQACDAEDPSACVSLAATWWRQGVHSSSVDRLLERACKADEARGCRLLANRLEQSLEPDDALRAPKLYRKGCELDDAEACLVLGLRGVEEGPDGADRQDARRMLERACELGSDRGCAASTRLAKVFAAPLNPDTPR